MKHVLKFGGERLCLEKYEVLNNIDKLLNSNNLDLIEIKRTNNINKKLNLFINHNKSYLELLNYLNCNNVEKNVKHIAEKITTDKKLQEVLIYSMNDMINNYDRNNNIYFDKIITSINNNIYFYKIITSINKKNKLIKGGMYNALAPGNLRRNRGNRTNTTYNATSNNNNTDEYFYRLNDATYAQGHSQNYQSTTHIRRQMEDDIFTFLGLVVSAIGFYYFTTKIGIIGGKKSNKKSKPKTKSVRKKNRKSRKSRKSKPKRKSVRKVNKKSKLKRKSIKKKSKSKKHL